MPFSSLRVHVGGVFWNLILCSRRALQEEDKKNLKNSEYYQEIPQSQIADNPLAPRG